MPRSVLGTWTKGGIPTHPRIFRLEVLLATILSNHGPTTPVLPELPRVSLPK